MPDERFFEPDVETMPRARIAALQEERILELVPYVYERSALVRKKWEEARVKPGDINSLADFTERVPFITKDDIREFRAAAQDPFGGLLCNGLRGRDHGLLHVGDHRGRHLVRACLGPVASVLGGDRPGPVGDRRAAGRLHAG